MKLIAKLFLLMLLSNLASPSYSQETAKVEKQTPHTYKLTTDSKQPNATLKDVKWLEGSWKGTAFGSQFEQVWNSESANTMVGMFKLYDDKKGVIFYELLLLKEENNSLSLLVKHFSPDFTAWEDKSDFIEFKLVKIEPDAIHFSGLSFYKKGADQMDGYIRMKQKDGSVTEHLLSYKK